MGCGLSKSSSDSDREATVTSSKFPPLLRRRFEEIRGRRRTTEKGTLSKKVLLKESLLDDHSASHSGHGDDNGRKSLSSAEEIFRAAIAKVIPEPEPEPEPLLDKDNKIEQEEKAAAEDKAEEENRGIEEEGEEEDRLSNVKNEYLSPGSPSFRVYIEPMKDDHDDESKTEETSQSSQADDNGEILESVASNEDSAETMTKEKGKRGKRFRRVMRKGKPSAVRNLLNAAPCYHLAVARHDKLSSSSC